MDWTKEKYNIQNYIVEWASCTSWSRPQITTAPPLSARFTTMSSLSGSQRRAAFSCLDKLNIEGHLLVLKRDSTSCETFLVNAVKQALLLTGQNVDLDLN